MPLTADSQNRNEKKNFYMAAVCFQKPKVAMLSILVKFMY